MCGRYLVTVNENLINHYQLDDVPPLLRLQYTAVPGGNFPVVINQNNQPQLQLKHWGITPAWSKQLIFNTRAESVAVKPTFKSLFSSSRCLIPANYFYEWSGLKSKKIPYLFNLTVPSVFSFAGIYSPQGYTIITTAANDLIRPIHPRMPVILSPGGESRWLDRNTSSANLLSLLTPYPKSAMISSTLPVATPTTLSPPP